ncbi:MAG: peptidoglycan-binding protein, partial [Alphaproteobacteria bacterium]|nr:peptidoglycan-binding protein [Alphaproteobacteria bacterium]
MYRTNDLQKPRPVPFTLTGTMGSLTPDDVIKLKAALQGLGYYNDTTALRYEIEGKPFSPFAGVKFFDDLRTFQKRQGLKVDGIVNSGGPTHCKMVKLLGEHKSSEVDDTPFSNRPSFPKVSSPKPNCTLRVSNSPKIKDEMFAYNGRQVEGLMANSGIDFGLYPKLYADCLCGGNKEALNEYHDFLNQFSQRDPARAAHLHGLIVQEMTDREAPQTSLKKVAGLLQKQGRNGDTLLAHITPQEAIMLKEKGGAGTVNPVTGLLEFYGGMGDDSASDISGGFSSGYGGSGSDTSGYGYSTNPNDYGPGFDAGGHISSGGDFNGFDFGMDSSQDKEDDLWQEQQEEQEQNRLRAEQERWEDIQLKQEQDKAEKLENERQALEQKKAFDAEQLAQAEEEKKKAADALEDKKQSLLKPQEKPDSLKNLEKNPEALKQLQDALQGKGPDKADINKVPGLGAKQMEEERLKRGLKLLEQNRLEDEAKAMGQNQEILNVAPKTNKG